jgi:N-acyl-D-amino-acid deacylase
MFQSVKFAEQLGVKPPAASGDVIRAMITQPLDFDPGTRYAYSNFGYNLLGRVIENVSGQTYEAYVQQHVLKPIGIERMRIGGTRLENRIEGEVRYYDAGTGRSVFAGDLGHSVPHPYGAWHLEAMDSHGGWVASAVDLARFVTAMDDFDNCPLLCRASIEAMFGRPNGEAGADPDGKPKDVFYALGWQVRDLGDGRYNRWHTGSLPGTTTIMIRRHDGRNFVGLLNTRVSPATSPLGGDLDREINSASARVDSWPDYDLFPDFSKPESSAAVR